MRGVGGVIIVEGNRETEVQPRLETASKGSFVAVRHQLCGGDFRLDDVPTGCVPDFGPAKVRLAGPLAPAINNCAALGGANAPLVIIQAVSRVPRVAFRVGIEIKFKTIILIDFATGGRVAEQPRDPVG